MARTKQTARKTPEQLAEMDEERKRIYGDGAVPKPKKPKKRKPSEKPKKPKKRKKAKKKEVTLKFLCSNLLILSILPTNSP